MSVTGLNDQGLYNIYLFQEEKSAKMCSKLIIQFLHLQPWIDLIGKKSCAINLWFFLKNVQKNSCGFDNSLYD